MQMNRPVLSTATSVVQHLTCKPTSAIAVVIDWFRVLTGAHLHLVYEDEEPEELPVRRRQMADNLHQQDMLSDMDALYCMLMGLGMLD